jgi:hypothetical protein
MKDVTQKATELRRNALLSREFITQQRAYGLLQKYRTVRELLKAFLPEEEFKAVQKSVAYKGKKSEAFLCYMLRTIFEDHHLSLNHRSPDLLFSKSQCIR